MFLVFFDIKKFVKYLYSHFFFYHKKKNIKSMEVDLLPSFLKK